MPDVDLLVRLLVTLNGVALPNVLAAHMAWSFDGQGYGEATITLPAEPAGWQQWQEVVIYADAPLVDGPTPPGTPALQFRGVLVDGQYGLWEPTFTLVCKGPLYVAEVTENLSEDPTVLEDPDPDDVAGLDFSNEGAGATPEAMVDRMLTLLGLGAYYTYLGPGDPANTIGGPAVVLGANSDDQFFWRRGEPAQAFLARLQAVCLGFRLFETKGGAGQQIFFTQITADPKPDHDGDAGAPLTIGVDLFTGDTASVELVARNRQVVTPWEDGSGMTDPWIATAAHPAPPPGVAFVTNSLSSGLIERWSRDEPDDGLSAQDVAEWLLAELNRTRRRTTCTTWRGGLVGEQFGVGQTHQISGGQRLGMAPFQMAWLQSHAIDVTANEWTVTNTYLWSPPLAAAGVGESGVPIEDGVLGLLGGDLAMVLG